MDRLLYRMDEAANVLGISRTKAYALAAAGLLPGVVRLGKSLRVSVRALEEWIRANEAAGASGEGRPAAGDGERIEGRNVR
jgi:excisionase family DNA binding protein